MAEISRRTRPWRRRPAAALTASLAVCLAVPLAACSGGEATPDADPSTTPPDEAAALTVGYFPLVHTATAVNAAESGLFAREGLDVELVVTGGGAEAIPALVAGEYDVVYTNYTSALLAAERGLPIVFVAGNDLGGSDHGVFVADESPIQSVADLAGASFAVNNLQNIGTIAITRQVEEVGVDPSDVTLLEMPFPAMQAALIRGDVDAIWQVEPFQASAQASGLRKIGDLFAGASASMPVAGWVSTREFATKNPETIEAFRTALAHSVEDLSDNRARLVELVPSYTEVDAAVVEAVELPLWESQLDAAGLQVIADLMHSYGITSQAFDVATMLPA
ncbi:ABC transporter substrate-binding protein [Xylanimonas ulmi]|uniref:NitT/TauT family transport system substrate-binding protein n=1 Tax=Xylanimonas ulmi TaxID=228973 RepID=A0A4Q7M6V9_9MICO|nr:ABC transporter substrate-binding protein [Xylanibacterium ulmi]RZS62358.1 NitT/TauT family transport system substrate-binding protein [Xylanibacterium ulmi]